MPKAWDQARVRARSYQRRPYKPVAPVGFAYEKVGEGSYKINGELCDASDLQELTGMIDEDCCESCGHILCSCCASKWECDGCGEYVTHPHDEDKCIREHVAEQSRREAQAALHPEPDEIADRLIRGVVDAYVERKEPLPVNPALTAEMVLKILDRWSASNMETGLVHCKNEVERTRVLQWNAARKLFWVPGAAEKFCERLDECVKMAAQGLTEEQIKKIMVAQASFPINPQIENGQAALPGPMPEASEYTLAAFREQFERKN